jgi:hypothetical protein
MIYKTLRMIHDSIHILIRNIYLQITCIIPFKYTKAQKDHSRFEIRDSISEIRDSRFEIQSSE